MTAAPAVGQEPIIVGIDTHKETHHAAILSARGKFLADRKFPATALGYSQLLTWTATVGTVAAFGIECTGSYGAGLLRHLLAEGHDVREVNRPHAHTAARRGKTDAIDAEAAARKVLAGEAPVVPKDTTGAVESIRMLTLARNSAVKARSTAQTQLQNVLITAPHTLREQINSDVSGPKARVAACSRLRPNISRLNEPAQAAKLTLRSLAQRVESLDDEIATLDRELGQLVAATTPTLVSKLGIGTGHAAQFLISAGGLTPCSWTRVIQHMAGGSENPRMARKSYTDEFRCRAVDLYESTPGATLQGIAADLGVSRGSLKGWVDKLGSGTRTASAAAGVSVGRRESQAARITRLEAENGVLRVEQAKLAEERDILRQAAKYFAGETSW
ncbi:Transposase [Tsukamurella paurometabola]|uniref:Transposase IS3/IS911 family protein n=2 Tax=Tsukamurella paurometabola (strain ATCC 8368 / DSM 20162 / CCUG 35730 / CIP 100753 / JCM 10117 / KCTC 9821 / NBRC 16120 / NCIMB 702349 / NCTC 13040) TaxID=521096 RepID=D5UQT4_TSUPD|nr:transposase IS3/IS911 family protein [Tsukamurella paurometabola DSM 20162]SUP42193.1 Transposase [Tsukamurella paurometabola]